MPGWLTLKKDQNLNLLSADKPGWVGNRKIVLAFIGDFSSVLGGIYLIWRGEVLRKSRSETLLSQHHSGVLVEV